MGRGVWTARLYELGVSDIALTSAALSALVERRALHAAAGSGAVPCRLLSKPELVLRLFLEALNFVIHDGAIDVRWCRMRRCERPASIFNHSDLVRDPTRRGPPPCVRSSDHGRALSLPASPAAPRLAE